MKARRVISVVAAAVIVVALWQVVAMAVSAARGVPFPAPLDTVRRALTLLGGKELTGRTIYVHVLHSLARWVTGFVVAAVLGVAYGLAAGWWSWLEDVTAPIVHILQLIPGLAWIPVALLLFGIGEAATVFMIGITAFTPVAINVLGGVKRVDATYLRAARMMGARGPGLLFRVLLPGALPHILSGLRVGLGNGWRVLVAAEMVVGTGTGLGYSIIEARWTLDYTSAFVCIGVICIIGLLMERLVFAAVERRTVERWGLSRTGP